MLDFVLIDQATWFLQNVPRKININSYEQTLPNIVPFSRILFVNILVSKPEKIKIFLNNIRTINNSRSHLNVFDKYDFIHKTEGRKI
jgi:hypothetical protein